MGYVWASLSWFITLQSWFQLSSTGWWEHDELHGKWRQSTSVPYINKDTHPPFSLRFNTRHQPGLDLQMTLLSSHPPHIMQRLWHFDSGDHFRVPRSCSHSGLHQLVLVHKCRSWGAEEMMQSPNPIFYTLYSVTKAFPVAKCLLCCLPAGFAWQVTDDEHFLAARGRFCFPGH